MRKNRPKDYRFNSTGFVEAITFTTKKSQRLGWGKTIYLLVGNNQGWLHGNTIINFDSNGGFMSINTGLAMAEVIELLFINKYEMMKCHRPFYGEEVVAYADKLVFCENKIVENNIYGKMYDKKQNILPT